MTGRTRTEVTYNYERWRAFPAGVIDAGATVFLLLIAVRYYHAGPLAKAVVASGGSLGLILAPWLVSSVEASGWLVAKAAARLVMIGAMSFLAMAMFPMLPVFVIGCIVALTTTTAVIPLLTQIYQENYPEHDRGRRFATTTMIRVATTVVFSDLAGRALSGHIDRFRWLLVIFAIASAFASFCLSRCPSRQLTASGGTHPFHALHYIRDDRLFRQTIIAWMFLGFATLMMRPLKVEYLANDKYGIQWHGQLLTAVTIALLTGVIPNVARLVLIPVWGWLFDHMNFFILRIMLNLSFAVGILSFFTTNSGVGLVVGAIVFGMSNAGADVAWSLWVTKFAPPERVADYMSVHTFFTGVRGILAPLVAFYFVSAMPFYLLGWISVGLILIACAFLVPEIKFGKTARFAAPLEEEISE